MFLVLPAPFLLGSIPTKYMGETKRTPAMAYVCGWFLSFAVFEVVAIPFILLKKSFTAVVIVYTGVIAVLLLYSLLFLKESIKIYANGFKRQIMTMPLLTKAGWLAVFAIIGAQMIYAVMYEYYDGDDAYYIAMAVNANVFDDMYLRDTYTGYSFQLDIRHALSPTPLYQAWLSRLSGIAPAAVAHTMLAPVWLMFMYCVYGQIADRLFNDEKKAYRPMFMILISVWMVFGNVSMYTAETFAMTRTWQGKGLLAGIVLPALLLCFLDIYEGNVSRGTWMMLVCVILSAVLATSISFMLIPTLVGLAAVLICVKNKNIKTGVSMLVCLIPCLVLGSLYLMMK